MRDCISISSTLTGMRMLYTDYDILHIAVEGGSDKRLLSTFLDVKNIKVKIMGGWENVVSLIELANSEHADCVLGLIDSDYHRVSANTRHSVNSIENIVYTDHHDIEMMLFCSNALAKYLSVKGHIENRVSVDDYRKIVLDLAKPLGILRLISIERGLNLWFDDIRYIKFIRRESLEIDIREMVRIIICRTCSETGQSISTTVEALLSSITEPCYCSLDPLLLCNGHDVLNIVVISMQRKFGSIDPSKINEQDTFDNLLLAYTNEEFETTILNKKIMEWINTNSVINDQVRTAINT